MVAKKNRKSSEIRQDNENPGAHLLGVGKKIDMFGPENKLKLNLLEAY